MISVGAGLAGLRVAYILTRANLKVVPEARDRVGGRTLSLPYEDQVFRAGAETSAIEESLLESAVHPQERAARLVLAQLW